jgi:hypothetical protein
MPKNLFVSGISEQVEKRDLEDEFGKSGPVVSIDIKANFAFIEFEKEADAEGPLPLLARGARARGRSAPLPSLLSQGGRRGRWDGLLLLPLDVTAGLTPCSHLHALHACVCVCVPRVADALNRLTNVEFLGKTLHIEWGKNKQGTGGAKGGYLGLNRVSSVGGDRLYVGNLPMEATMEDMEMLFGEFRPTDVCAGRTRVSLSGEAMLLRCACSLSPPGSRPFALYSQPLAAAGCAERIL